jgi:hypothetical protein
MLGVSRLLKVDWEVDTCLSGSETMLGGTEHKGFVENSNTPQFSFELLHTGCEGAGLLVEVGNADGGTFQDGGLGGLLVGGGEGLLETVVALSKFITATLFRLDTLFADIFTTAFGFTVAGGMRSEIVVFLKIAEIVFLLDLSRGSTSGWTG